MPYYIAIYLYGYKSKSIWNTKTHNQSLKHWQREQRRFRLVLRWICRKR
jgi:hypothetical protein